MKKKEEEEKGRLTASHNHKITANPEKLVGDICKEII